jgi:hypothetical protein
MDVGRVTGWKNCLFPIPLLIALACASPEVGRTKLTINLGQSAQGALQVEAGQTLLIQLIVLGAEGQEVVITGTVLPAFATLEGSLLRLAPGMSTLPGDYPLELTAAAGMESTKATAIVSVHRQNTAPSVSEGWALDGELAKCGCFFQFPYLNTNPPCHYTDDPGYGVMVKDAEGDSFVMEFEVQPEGTAFTGVATHSFPHAAMWPVALQTRRSAFKASRSESRTQWLFERATALGPAGSLGEARPRLSRWAMGGLRLANWYEAVPVQPAP